MDTPIQSDTPSTPRSSKPKKSNTRWVIRGVAVVILIVAAVTLVSTHSANTKKTATAATTKSPDFVASTNTSSAITGITVPAAQITGYTRENQTSDVIAKSTAQQKSEGLADFYTVAGGVDYYTGDTTNGNYVDIQWGTLGKSWSLDDFKSKAIAYLNSQTKDGTYAAADDGTINVKGSDNKAYTVPCTDFTKTNSNGSAGAVLFSCNGPMDSTDRFLSLTVDASDGTLATGKAVIQKFAGLMTVQFKD